MGQFFSIIGLIATILLIPAIIFCKVTCDAWQKSDGILNKLSKDYPYLEEIIEEEKKKK